MKLHTIHQLGNCTIGLIRTEATPKTILNCSKAFLLTAFFSRSTLACLDKLRLISICGLYSGHFGAVFITFLFHLKQNKISMKGRVLTLAVNEEITDVQLEFSVMDFSYR